MKVRQGFVSNSSSSSFIIARAQIGEEKWNALVAYLNSDELNKRPDDDEDGYYYEEYYPSIEKNYIEMDTSDRDNDKFYAKIAELGIGSDDYMTTYS